MSRNAGSGTREVFQRRVPGENEPGTSSLDCQHRDAPRARVTRCEPDSAEQALDTVARLPGAIGYGKPRASADGKGPPPRRTGGRALSRTPVVTGTS
ncbi:hypothetical protein [Streptomyces sp. WAC08241]|uniref:hypothetical protein n=1 Tax=Streptomyces sp. WAC08241 TaxID=2487421 RepID=UPI000F7B0983|nr:hypothetical protein [Streptomyces sp. WAC08241]RSS43101.1 hypothetical protein EF906_10565 [Streptomyces sp. WAC08241]